ncbi:MAG TPA: universal stress protein, partial [Pyrinomonadaceae bacterium]|jgi:nucleotide-binding universal stress UspA family protein|nr:universal stress protein [Pyrinomonadaceae bacterium]
MKILLAIDGSPCSERAVAEVARRPWPDDSQLRIVSVVEPPAPLVAEPYAGIGGYFEEVERLKRGQAGEVVARAAEALRAGKGTALMGVSTGVITGSPKRTIVEESEEWGADLVVLGSHGYHTWERMLIGSVSQSVAAHARCSVEIVRCRAEKSGV